MGKRRISSREGAQLRVADIVRELDALAPESCAESWDNVGLLVGDTETKVSSAMVSVDLTNEAIEQAQRWGAQLIVNHHPCIFPKQKGISRVVSPSLVFQAARARIAVHSCHTNFDRCALEVPQQISEALGIRVLGRLLDDPHHALKKLVVFVPESHADVLHLALSETSAGHVGNYDACAFLGEGEGRYRGNEFSNPFLGQPKKLERAREIRLETVFPAGMEPQILRAMREVHPYEEIAYDVYSLEQRAVANGVTKGLGYGFFGDLLKPTAQEKLIEKIGKTFEASGGIFTASARAKRSGHRVHRVAFVAGKGSSFVSAAVAAGCDFLITGEVGYHDALSAARRGLSVLELGHRESERFYLKTMTSWLRKMGLRVRELNSPEQKIRSF